MSLNGAAATPTIQFVTPAGSPQAGGRIRWWYVAGYAVVLSVALLRVGATHRIFSQVVDEPLHLAAGFEWISRGSYSLDPGHPPLARVLAALPVYWRGVPPPRTGSVVEQGNEILYFGDRYARNLALARKGNLVLFALGIAAVALWARRWFAEPVPLIATTLFTSLPPVLAHAGLVTTDLAVTATLAFALYTLDRFVERPTPRRGGLLGLALALGAISKFSFLLFFPVCAALVLLARRGRRDGWWKGVAAALLVAVLVAWGGYRFHIGRIVDLRRDAEAVMGGLVSGPLETAALWISRHAPVPAPEYVLGVATVKAHDDRGHHTYLLGRSSQEGWWYYFPVVFFFKTPIPFLILIAWGAVAVMRTRGGWVFPLIAAAIMACVMPSSINIGLRHVLPIYVPLSIVAAVAVVDIWERTRNSFTRATLGVLLAWLFLGGARAHPDYLAWFNGFAGASPERITVGSNLDWGQDILRLERVVAERGIEHMHASFLSSADLERHGIVAQKLSPFEPVTGWIAISETSLRIGGTQGKYRWLDSYEPVQRVGKSIRLYHLSE